MKVSHDQFSMLLAGDVEGSAATSIANTLGARLQSTVYKIAHHGASKLANSVTWLTPIKPYSAPYEHLPPVHITLVTVATLAVRQSDALKT